MSKIDRILVTGGAGFVGSALACRLKSEFSSAEVIALDNLRRRGSELALAKLRHAGVSFVHGDIRIASDVLGVGKVDLVLDCAAEPSALAGLDGSVDYVLDTNLAGTFNILELCRRQGAKLIFLSTSRVYPYEPINSIPFSEAENRFEVGEDVAGEGYSHFGISERFPLSGARTIYGATKLCSELLIQEYEAAFGVPALINRCGVLTGPGQMGKVDQGFVVLWASRFIYGGSLSYLGFEGSGKQVRDMLHVDDLFDLLQLQIKGFDSFRGRVWNVGGGKDISISLRELSELCGELTGARIQIRGDKSQRPGDVPWYITDSRDIEQFCGWSPKRGKREIVEQIVRWISDGKEELRPILG